MGKTEKIANGILKIGPLGNPKVLCSYIVTGQKTSIIDCGPSAVVDELLDIVDSCGFSPNDIDQLLLTHVHIDHAGGAGKFLSMCRKATAYVPKRGYKYLLDPFALNNSAKSVLGEQIFFYWGECEPVSASRLNAVEPNQIVDLGESQIKYIEATGHAPHHNILLESKNNILFAADALGIFDDLINFQSPTSPPPSFDFVKALQDIKKIQVEIKPSQVCLAHFRAITPDSSFYASVLEMYSMWKRVIYDSRFSKNDSNFTADDLEEVYNKLLEIYPSFAKIESFLREQIKRVDIAGFVQYLQRSKTTS